MLRSSSTSAMLRCRSPVPTAAGSSSTIRSAYRVNPQETIGAGVRFDEVARADYALAMDRPPKPWRCIPALLVNPPVTVALAVSLSEQGIETGAAVLANLGTAALVEEAIRNGEGRLAKHGPLVVETGKHTGRSARDKFIVRDAETESTVWWGKVNVPMTPEHFAALKADFLAALGQKDKLYIADLFGGSQPEHRVNVRVINELAWHNLFVRTLLVRPTAEELTSFAPEYTIIDLPSFRADPARHGTRSETVVAVNLSEKLILIGGTAYAGEMKKSVFGILNYLLPPKGVMPMHCSANMGPEGDTAVFFGLSGTGKTTLSADASRTLIGDD